MVSVGTLHSYTKFPADTVKASEIGVHTSLAAASDRNLPQSDGTIIVIPSVVLLFSMRGKLPPDILASLILDRTGADDPAVLQGAGYGEDAAAIDIGGEILVVSSDPLSMAESAIGRLGVTIACNDVAASGARPRWLTNTLFVPDATAPVIDTITRQIDATATHLDVSVVGGHSEILPSLDRPLLCMTAMGLTDTYIPAGGANPGDAVILSSAAGIEGTAILADDFRDDLLAAGIDSETLDHASQFASEVGVIDEAAATTAYATAMHDPTEGGVLTGLIEMANAAGRTFDIDADSIPIRDETRVICQALDVDPLRIFGSGALLLTVPEQSVEAVLSALNGCDVTATRIGTVTEGASRVRVDSVEYTTAPRDDLYPLWE